VDVAQAAPAIPREPDAPVPTKSMSSGDHSTLFEVDSTLTNLARVAQELTQQKLAAIERETALEQWQARLQQEQNQLDEKVRELEQRTTQLHDQSLAVSQRTEALKVMTSQVSGLRQSLRGMLLELDRTLDS
jgi:predicted ribosome quality control (RQC) complex YloA/Tae2 family protein